jgi:hypothetical protein
VDVSSTQYRSFRGPRWLLSYLVLAGNYRSLTSKPTQTVRFVLTVRTNIIIHPASGSIAMDAAIFSSLSASQFKAATTLRARTGEEPEDVVEALRYCG